MSKSIKNKLISILAMLAILFTAAFFAFIRTETKPASADSADWTGYGVSYTDFFGWSGYNGETYSFNTSTGYASTTRVNGWGSRLVNRDNSVKLHGAKISIYCNNIVTSGNDSDWFGFCLGSDQPNNYPSLSATQFCVTFRPRLWSGQTRVSIATNHNHEGISGYQPVAFKDTACSDPNISNVGVKEYVMTTATTLGLSFEFSYVSASKVWKVTVTDLYGGLWEASSTTIYVPASRIKAASGSGTSTRVFAAIYAGVGSGSPATNMAMSIKIEDDNSKASFPQITSSSDGTAFISNISQGPTANVRFAKNSKVTLDGLTVKLYDTQMPTAYGQYFGFGFAKTKSAIPNSEQNSLNVVFAPGRWSGQTRLVFNNSANDNAAIVYTDKALTNQAIGSGTPNYVFKNEANIGVSLTFNHLTGEGVWEMKVTVTAGTLVGTHVSTLYFAESWANNVLDANGKCYLVAYGFIDSTQISKSARFHIKADNGYTVTEVVNGVTTTSKYAVGSTYTFKQKYIKDKLNIGWKIGNTFYYNGDTFTVNANTTVTASFVDFYQVEGASVLLSYALDYSGIRFKCALKKATYDAYSSKISGMGIIVMPADMIEDGKEFTLANYSGSNQAENIYTESSNFAFSGGETVLNAAIIRLYPSNYSRLFAARSYLKLANGKLVYLDYVKSNNARTIHTVAEKALAAGSADTNNGLTIYMDGVPNVTETSGTYALIDTTGRAASEKIIKSVTGSVSGTTVTLKFTVNASKFNSVLGGSIKGLIYNGYRIKTFTQSLSSSTLTVKFTKLTKTYADTVKNIWLGDTMYDESIVLTAPTDANNKVTSAPKAKLILDARTILSVKWYFHNSRKSLPVDQQTITFTEGVDYKYENGYIVALGSINSDGTFKTNMPYVTDKQVSGDVGWPNLSGTYPRVGGGTIPFTENNEIHQMQLAVTYTHDVNAWGGFKPSYQGSGLPKTMAKLNAGKDVKLFVYGDSVATGANTSKYLGNNPFTDDWMTLFADNLGSYYGVNVALTNKSSGGYTSNNGVNGGGGWINHGQYVYQAGLNDMFYSNENFSGLTGQAAPWNGKPKGILKGYVPDLVILRFGANDSSIYSGIDTTAFYNNIKSMITTLRKVNSNVEIIIKPSFYTNALADGYNDLKPYNAKLVQIANEESGVIYVDVCSFQNSMYSAGKRFIDLTTNNINHPNDFFARTFAMCLLSSLINY